MMLNGKLSDYFTGVAAKRLALVELPRSGSNQHELNGSAALRDLLGRERSEFSAKFIYLSDRDDRTLVEDGHVTWYDARDSSPTRTEYRLYYKGNTPMEEAKGNDLLVLAPMTDGCLLFLVVDADSTSERQVQWLFGIHNETLESYSTKRIEKEDDVKLSFGLARVLEQLGIAVETESLPSEEALFSRWGNTFPTTREFSHHARECIGSIHDYPTADVYLLTCFETEERLFKAFERVLLQRRLSEGFAGDVDSFISYSLSVHNRRKSRAGYALENHLEHILICNNVRYERGKVTESKSKPDFLFPGQSQYRDRTFPSAELRMLAVKTSCKDRWRQILAEAARIPEKHLLTIESGISPDQTKEMSEQKVRLVIPESLHASYLPSQQANLMSVEEFLEIVS